MKFSKKTLKNGLRVVTVPMKDNPTVTVLVLVETGSEYEDKKLSGISHFLEHMCFKGTIRRPKAIDIARELDAIGSQYNAFTGTEYTGYYAKSDAKHFKKVLDVISDIYLNSTFPEAEIEKEKGVIIEEMNMYEDLPNRQVQELMSTLLYGDQPAGRNIIGNKKTVLAVKRSDLVKYQSEHYVPKSTILVVAGQINEKEVWKDAGKIFGAIKVAKKTTKVKTTESQSRPKVLVKHKQTDQTHLVIGLRTYDLFDKRNPVLEVLGGILGGGMSSRLFQKLREEMGVGYYVRSFNDPSTDHGSFQVAAGVDNKRSGEVVLAILEELQKLKKDEVMEEELEKVKECLIGNMKLSLESTDDIANFYGGQEVLRKKIETAEAKALSIRKVTAKQVREVADEIFKNNKLNLTIVGPYKSGLEFQKILKF